MSKGSLRSWWWVWLARLSAQTRTHNRVKWLLYLGAVAILVLGLLGWHELDEQRRINTPGWIALDRWTLFYRSLTLFTGEAAEPYNVPWQLQLARILALGVVGFGVFVWVVRRTTEHLIRKGARKATGHTVMVGPVGLPEAVLAERGQESETAGKSLIVRVMGHDDGGSPRNTIQQASKGSGDPDQITVHVDLDDDEWLEKTNATRANLVVLSDESDRQTIRLARQLIEAGQETGGHLVVNLNGWETAQWFDLYLAKRHPTASVEVGCVAEAAIIEQVVQQLPDLAQTDATQPELAVAGQSDSRVVVLRLLVRQLADYYYGRYPDAPPRIHLVQLDERGLPAPAGVDSDFISDNEPLVLCNGGAELDLLRRALIIVIDDDSDQAAQLELQLLTRFAPDEMVMRLDPDSLMHEASTTITTRAAMHILRGPVYALSQSLLEDASDRATNERRIDLTGRDDAPKVTREQLRRTRQIIGKLGEEGQVIIARDGPPADDDDELSNEQLGAIAKGFASIDSNLGPRSVRGLADASNLRAELTRAGYDFDIGDK